MSISDEIQKFIWEVLSSVQTPLIVLWLYVNSSNMCISVGSQPRLKQSGSLHFTGAFQNKIIVCFENKVGAAATAKELTNTFPSRIAHKKGRNGTIPAACHMLLALLQRTRFLSIGEKCS